MTLYEIITNLEEVASSHKLVNEVHEGDVYKVMNSGMHKYSAVHVTCDSASEDENTLKAHIVLFYIDRLEDNVDNNLLQVQSTGTRVLSEIIHRFIDEYYINVDNISYNYFEEKFADVTGGVYATFDVEVSGSVVLCDENSFE